MTKEPEDRAFEGTTLLSHFTELPRGNVRLGAAGKIMSAKAALHVLETGCDFVAIGRAAILRHNFPELVRLNPDYDSPVLPVTAEHLREEGLSDAFIDYMRSWPGFVTD